MKTLIIALFTVASSLFAKSPDGFDNNVFVNFMDAKYNVVFDVPSRETRATSTIIFSQTEKGYPLFDFVGDVESLSIDGITYNVTEVASPDGVTKYKRIDELLLPGDYKMVIETKLKKNVKLSKRGVKAAFWMSDLTDRNYLEKYLPTNLEYDQYQMTLNVSFIGVNTEQTIYTNGVVKVIGSNQFNIVYPNYFTSSSLYFHTAKVGNYNESKFNYTSMNSNVIPVTVYARTSYAVRNAVSLTKKTLTELEAKFGPWGHPSLTIYAEGQGGMEYAGATRTAANALGHELTHSYFARGVMPLDGNSGWLDEAIASWRDKGYKKIVKPNFANTDMAAHSQYKRTTDRRAYSNGANFMGFLNYELQGVGGLSQFLSILYLDNVHTSINTPMFKLMIETFSGRSFEKEFNQYVYGIDQTMTDSDVVVVVVVDNPYHPFLTEQEELDLL